MTFINELIHLDQLLQVLHSQKYEYQLYVSLEVYIKCLFFPFFFFFFFDSADI